MIETFGHMPDGTAVQRVRISGGGLTANVITYGASVQGLWIDGIDHSVVLGSETFDPYLSEKQYFGAVVGRVANRIGNASFTLEGKTYQLDTNYLGRHLLHGGSEGVGVQVWSIADVTPESVTLSLTEPDGHMGFPGELAMQVTYTLKDGALCVEFAAQADRDTPCNLAQHSYFNLDGDGSVLDQNLRISADHYTAVDADKIPTGDPVAVDGTPFDFRADRQIGDHGYDHNFCLSRSTQALRPVAWLTSKKSGVQLTVETVETGLQVYDAQHFPADGMEGLGGLVYRTNGGLALETQAWPDAINQSGYPECVIGPNRPYSSETRYKFAKV